MKNLCKINLFLAIAMFLSVGLVISPLWASTQVFEEPRRSLVETNMLESTYRQYAQVGGDEIGDVENTVEDEDPTLDRGGEGYAGTTNLGQVVAISDARTEQIVNQLYQIQKTCEFMTEAYRVSCFASTYRKLADEIDTNGDYAEVKRALADAARKLSYLAQKNVDRSQPLLRARLTTKTGETVTTPPIVAIRNEVMNDINRQGSEIIAETETILLRSADANSRVAIHYQRIAAVVGSNKVLLRSS